jgi:hypothetical protein
MQAKNSLAVLLFQSTNGTDGRGIELCWAWKKTDGTFAASQSGLLALAMRNR